MNRFVIAERAVRTAAPHQLLDAVRRVLVEQYAADSVELFMADYGLTVLQPVSVLPHTMEPVSVHNSPEGRAFGAQEPFVEDAPGGGSVRAHLPVSVRGDRLGVLSVVLPGGDHVRGCLAELAEIAEVLGREVVVAERDTDLYLQARRKDRLTLAAEMQWQLLPGRSCTRPEYELGAQLEPAYAIFGDNFDWSATAEHLMLYVTNGMGEGIEASLLTNLAINALRNARRAGLPISDQAALADQAVYAQYRGECYLSMLMFDFELATGRAWVVDAGSPQMLRLRAGSVERVELEAQLPLGMFEETDYVAQEFRVEPGDRLLFVSDGVYAVASPKGEAYGDAALARAIQATRLLPAAEVPRAVLRELTGHRGRPVPDDDALVVCLDWLGR
ncbi:PP2C family protein-serine/threonine phosphatase [Streptomyces rochei]|uniref:Serine/threonine-protein phosphatase n=1 Tax=Streptomyces vinaceusdrappus TaxID=67376 RepID=A0ABY6BMI9_9ACTN|nr:MULTISPECIES: PP2C family protein-serine/threonine phosphatase [Streptomyces]WDI16442.1 PP2C family protein-serine/threonine phosphatase [Streptomyces enissocaesilis]KYK13385.1 phosphatase [Streptomyces sp. CC71]MCC8451087.1 serine/threonine-protein phosphatase [Streptomyces rochei]NEC77086.1 serine/threonine-protein phosphatase [Streptomyces rochei]QCR45669.1 serine/threonine-protein phosphatase [Streptomyces sp. SGAir0924]